MAAPSQLICAVLLLSAVMFCSSVDASTTTHAQCTEEQLNRAKLRFKDCMEDKKAYLVQLDYEEDADDVQLLICSGLKELATGCKAAVKEFSMCQGREHVDHLVNIHLSSISDVLAPFHPSLRLRDCPVFNQPPPIIHKKPEPEAAAAAEPEYEPITGGSGFLMTSLPVLAVAFLTLNFLSQ
jgi:hypothetical protein